MTGDKLVKKGKAATVTCTLTGLEAAVKISWYIGVNPIVGDPLDAGECPVRKSQG